MAFFVKWRRIERRLRGTTGELRTTTSSQDDEDDVDKDKHMIPLKTIGSKTLLTSTMTDPTHAAALLRRWPSGPLVEGGRRPFSSLYISRISAASRAERGCSLPEIHTHTTRKFIQQTDGRNR